MNNYKNVEELVQQVKNGDSDAFGEIFEILADELYRYILLKTRNITFTEDVISESFKKAFINIHQYKQDNFRAYMYKIVRNTMIDYIRKDSKVKVTKRVSSLIIDLKQNIEKNVIDSMELERVLECLEMIDEHQRHVVQLRFIEGYSSKDVAFVLGKSNNNIRVIQTRAIRKIKDCAST